MDQSLMDTQRKENASRMTMSSVEIHFFMVTWHGADEAANQENSGCGAPETVAGVRLLSDAARTSTRMGRMSGANRTSTPN